MAHSPTVALDFLGCKVNQAEIEVLAQHFQQAGYTLAASDEQADIYVLNTCTITHVADRKARLLIGQARRRHRNALVVVTGCYPSVEPGAVQAINGVDVVVPNRDKLRLVEIVGQRLPPDRAAIQTPVKHGALDRTRAMLKVQDGCDHFCTYCIVPRARGGISSEPIPAVIEAIQERVAQGYQEVVLTGVALGSYGRERSAGNRGNELRQLVEAILVQTHLPRLRLSSIEPENLDPGLLEMWSDRRFCRHLHLPLQSGSDATLKRMGRRYSAAQYAHLVELARAIAPDAAMTTDMIVGFPGENAEAFAESLAFAQAMQFAKIHVFRFSARQGTPATRLPDPVPERVKKERATTLAHLSDRSALAFRRHFIGSQRDVLWEERSPHHPERWWTGLTDNYIRVYTQSGADLHNRISAVRLTGMTDDGMVGAVE